MIRCYITHFLYFTMLSSGRSHFDAVHVGETVYFVGGLCNDSHRNTLEIYCRSPTEQNQVENSLCSTQLSAPTQPRYDHCTAVLNGKIYFIGGKYSAVLCCAVLRCVALRCVELRCVVLCCCYLYSYLLPLYSTFALFCSVLPQGCSRGHSVLKTVECYDPSNNTWSNVAPLAVERSGACAVIHNKCIVVIGGSNQKKPQNSCEIYDANKNQWEYIARK